MEKETSEQIASQAFELAKAKITQHLSDMATLLIKDMHESMTLFCNEIFKIVKEEVAAAQAASQPPEKIN